VVKLLVRRISVISAVLLSGLAAAPKFQRGQLAVGDDPLALFAELMPVLSHERCANCHGATDPYQGFYHPGAVSRTTPCENCHLVRSWILAPSGLEFFQKTTRELCHHFAAFDPANNPFLENHLQTDDFVNLAFIGRRGNAVGPEFTRTPPLSKAEFMRAFRTWVRDGGAACSGWEGTITEEQTIVGNAKRNALGGQTTHWQGGTRTLTITVHDGHATVASQVTGYDNTRIAIPGGNNCTVTVYSQKLYRIVGQASSAGSPPPAAPAPGDTMPTRPPPVPVTAPGKVRVGIDAAGNYRILVIPPGETIETTDYGRAENTCGTANPEPTQDTNTITWKPFLIDIVGTLSNPHDRRQLKDSRDIEITTNDTDRSMGIEVYGSASEIDGTSIPFRIKRSWDLRRIP
jgi:hypothetical protein